MIILNQIEITPTSTQKKPESVFGLEPEPSSWELMDIEPPEITPSSTQKYYQKVCFNQYNLNNQLQLNHIEPPSEEQDFLPPTSQVDPPIEEPELQVTTSQVEPPGVEEPCPDWVRDYPECFLSYRSYN